MAAPVRVFWRLAILATLGLAPAGCSAPTATLNLITFARKALVSAQQAQAAQHDELTQHLKKQATALDAAFDNDVRLVAAGQIKGASGEPIELTPEWVVSARKGYAAARDLIADEIRSAESSHAAELDNLKAADEALDMASQLIVRQSAIAEQIKQQLISVQRRLAHGK